MFVIVSKHCVLSVEAVRIISQHLVNASRSAKSLSGLLNCFKLHFLKILAAASIISLFLQLEETLQDTQALLTPVTCM